MTLTGSPPSNVKVTDVMSARPADPRDHPSTAAPGVGTGLILALSCAVSSASPTLDRVHINLSDCPHQQMNQWAFVPIRSHVYDVDSRFILVRCDNTIFRDGFDG